MLARVQELIVTRDMHERKRIMFERADAFVALPGGIGTLEELVEQITWAQLGRHKKPILIANIERLLGPALRAARSHGEARIHPHRPDDQPAGGRPGRGHPAEADEAARSVPEADKEMAPAIVERM